jgi:hypothetical protein
MAQPSRLRGHMKGAAMTTLDMSTPGELRLVLSGAAENVILTTLRHWPYWLRAEVESDPADATQHLSVTLVAGRGQEATLREILRRSFGLVFPLEGGSTALVTLEPPAPRRRGGSRRG